MAQKRRRSFGLNTHIVFQENPNDGWEFIGPMLLEQANALAAHYNKERENRCYRVCLVMSPEVSDLNYAAKQREDE